MKVNYEEILGAMVGLNKIADTRRAPATSRKLYQLRLKLTPLMEFYCEEETKLIRDVGATISSDGVVLFADPKQKKEYVERRNELLKMDEEFDMEKITIHDSELKEISGEEMWSLRHFVNFVE